MALVIGNARDAGVVRTDVDGADVTRVSDLVLGRTGQAYRLAGIDVSTRTLLRRAGPAALCRQIATSRIYDWTIVAAVVSPNGDGAGSALRLTSTAKTLHGRRPPGLEAVLALEDDRA